ncbi:phosphotransferase [Cryptosporangium sp. NPDC051539]|uniref:phosphotransferase n=1 Tax=Cryptosporangium sp. NPDC051539 TaxID=3363962 RepID=UPI003798A6BA
MQLSAALAAQVDRVRRLDPDQLATIEHAASLVPGIVAELDLAGFVSPLVEDDKPRFLLRFSSPADSVLKIYGDAPRGEGPLLTEWRRSGIPTPRLIHGELGGCSWLLLEYVRMAPVTPDLRLTDQLASWGAVMHRRSPAVAATLRPLAATMLPRWQLAAHRLRSLGHRVPAHWAELAEQAYTAGDAVPLHGDLAAANLGLTSDGVVLFDASALAGPREFDAARWCARLARHGPDPERALRRMAALEPEFDLGIGVDLLAVESVLEAGSLATAADPRPDVMAQLLTLANRILP